MQQCPRSSSAKAMPLPRGEGAASGTGVGKPSAHEQTLNFLHRPQTCKRLIGAYDLHDNVPPIAQLKARGPPHACHREEVPAHRRTQHPHTPRGQDPRAIPRLSRVDQLVHQPRTVHSIMVPHLCCSLVTSHATLSLSAPV